MHTRLLLTKSFARCWVLLPALLLLAACHRIEQPTEDPVPAVCGECETCAGIPTGPSLFGTGQYGWPRLQLSNPVMRLRPCLNPRNSDEAVYGRGPSSSPDAGVWVGNLRTGQERQLLPASVLWSDQVKWGAAGWLAFTGSNNQVWKVKANGDSLTQVTASGEGHAKPQWSPDGRQLACAQSTASGGRLVVIGLNGQPLQVLPLPAAVMEPLAWSPDGSRLAYWVLGNPGSVPSPGIYVYQFQTRRTDFIMDGTAPTPTGPQPQELNWLDWLADSRTLIWAGSKGLYRTTTGTEIPQTTLLHKGCQSRIYSSPSVSANGRTIVIERSDYEVRGTPQALYGEFNLIQMDADGRNERKITF